MKRQNLRTVSLIVVTFTYLLIGAAIFGYLESEHEFRQREYLELIELIVKRKYNISDEDYQVLTTTVIKSVPHKAGIQWRFSGAFYFATTVVTTIGYGHSTPSTVAGRSFCMIYALIGIPLGLVMFQSIGERMNTFVAFALLHAKRCFKAKNPEVTQTNLVMVVSILSTVLMTSMAGVFAAYERWDYFDALYYCFITLTTIGFGDFVALQKEAALQSKPEYVVLSLIFILFGLSVVSSAVNLLVLKFLTLNTEDEKRDEALRYNAALNPIQLDGDIITSAAIGACNATPHLPLSQQQSRAFKPRTSSNNININNDDDDDVDVGNDIDNSSLARAHSLATPPEPPLQLLTAEKLATNSGKSRQQQRRPLSPTSCRNDDHQVDDNDDLNYDDDEDHDDDGGVEYGDSKRHWQRKSDDYYDDDEHGDPSDNCNNYNYNHNHNYNQARNSSSYCWPTSSQQTIQQEPTNTSAACTHVHKRQSKHQHSDYYELGEQQTCKQMPSHFQANCAASQRQASAARHRQRRIARRQTKLVDSSTINSSSSISDASQTGSGAFSYPTTTTAAAAISTTADTQQPTVDSSLDNCQRAIYSAQESQTCQLSCHNQPRCSPSSSSSSTATTTTSAVRKRDERRRRSTTNSRHNSNCRHLHTNQQHHNQRCERHNPGIERNKHRY